MRNDTGGFCMRMLSFVLFLWACFALKSCSGTIEVSDKAATAFHEGQSEYQRKNFAAAEELLLSAIKASPEFPHALVALADVYLVTNRGGDAEQAFHKALGVLPTYIPALGGLGFLLLEQSRGKEAQSQFSKIVEINPSSTAAWLNLGAAQKASGELDLAAETLRFVMAQDPSEAKAAYNLGNTLYSMGDLAGAVSAYATAVQLSPYHADAYNNMANVLKDSGDKVASLKALQDAVRASPDHLGALVNLGGTYTDAGRLEEAVKVLERALELAPQVPEVLGSLGNALLATKRADEALVHYEKAVELKPGDAAFHRALGDALIATERYGEAHRTLEFAATAGGTTAGGSFAALGAMKKMLKDHEGSVEFYRRAIEVDPGTWSHYMNLGVVLADAHRSAEAIPLLKEASRLKQGDPLVLSNLGTVLHRTGQYEESILYYREALAITPSSPNLHYNLANSFLDAGTRTDFKLLNYAVHEYTVCLSAEVTYPGAMNNLGNALKEQDKLRDALRAWQGAFRLEGGKNGDIFSNLVHLRMFVADWSGWVRRYALFSAMLEEQLARPGNESVSCQPFHALLYPRLSPDLVLRVASAHARSITQTVQHYPPLNRPSLQPKDPHPRNLLVVGYLSHDFGDHPTGHLFSSVPSLHARREATVTARYYSLRGDDSSPYYARLLEDAPPGSVSDISSTPFDKAAALINSHRVDVLIDLDAWMKGSRPEILAMRPCALQVVYLGYPGSSGAGYIDMLVTDPIVSPPEVRQYYSESLILLSGTYQVNDYRHTFSKIHSDVAQAVKGTRRSEFDLPEEAVLLGNFNQLYKIDPSTLDLWTRVVLEARRRAVDARLWLLRFPAMAARRIINESRTRGMGAGEELVFSDRLGKEDHLRRMHLADTFLDNHHVNAHTTASEALWAGVPVVTWPGEGMASRVASSLVSAMGLGGLLVARTSDDFVEIAVQAAVRGRWRVRVRGQMEKERSEARLFDTQRWVEGFEKALRSAWDGVVAGAGAVHHIRP